MSLPLSVRFMATAIFAAAIGVGQSPLVNPDFSAGKPGQAPPGWRLGTGKSNATAQTEAAGACRSGKYCAAVQSVAMMPGAKAFLYQMIGAAPFRDRKFSFRAAVRANVVAPEDSARLLVRVHRADGTSCFFDDMRDRPIRSAQWAVYEISGIVCKDAVNLELGMQVWGIGTAWLDDVSLTFTEP